MKIVENIPVRHFRLAAKEPTVNHFSIRDITAQVAGTDFDEPLHRHDYFFLLVICSGAGRHMIDFTSYGITDRTVFLLRPGQVHQLQLAQGSSALLLQFSKEFYIADDRELRRAARQSCYYLAPDTFSKLENNLSYMLQEYTEKRDQYEQVIRANLNVLLIELIRVQNNTTRSQADLYVQEKLEKFFLLLDAHVTEHKRAADYAGMMNLSLYQFNTITKAALGKTVSELIAERLILEAKRYLLATTNQVSQIAYHLGYEDVSYFIRFFKKQTGHSPDAFRQNLS